MSERIDRGIRSSQWPLWLIAAIVVAGGGFIAWRQFSPMPAPQKSPAPLAQPARLDEPLAVSLYFPAEGMLVAAPATVPRQASAQAEAREVLAALFADQRAAQSAVLKAYKLRAFFLDTAGTGYVDLSPAGPGGTAASVRDELLGIYAMVNALTQTFEEIRKVRFLIEGSEAKTLSGHVDLSWTFETRMDLVRQ